MARLWSITCSAVAVVAIVFAWTKRQEVVLPGSVLSIHNTSRWSLDWKSDVEECDCLSEKLEDEEIGSCKLKGTVSDCCCDYATVNHLNQYHLHPLVSKLVTLPFFRYFKVNLWCDCPLWPDDGMCALQACSVCECEDSEVPKNWQEEEKRQPVPSCKGDGGEEFPVDRTVEPSIKKRLVNLPGWRGFSNPWMAEDKEETDYSYINLLVNSERYTGYKGEDAQRVWTAIYSQGCFEGSTNPGEDACTEKRVFFRLISGLHSSITAHIAKDFLVDENLGIWGPNLDLFEWKLGRPEFRSRVENLYFAFSFVLRAVMRAQPLLEGVDYVTGSPEEDQETADLLGELVNNAALQKACPVPFDEGRLWKGDQGPELRTQLQSSFQNITKIMDCVGCEKCRLWGKLQTLGIATALKILFHVDDCDSGAGQLELSKLILERNEVIALVNLLERLSQSVETYRVMSLMLEERNKQREEETLSTAPPAGEQAKIRQAEGSVHAKTKGSAAQ